MTKEDVKKLEDEIRELTLKRNNLLDNIREHELANDYLIDELVSNLYKARKENNRAEMITHAKTIYENLSVTRIIDTRSIQVKLVQYVQQSIFTKYPFELDLWMKAGNMHTIGAFPGVGKTTIGLNICFNMYRLKMVTVFFSLEQVEADIWIKLVQLHIFQDTQTSVPLRVLMEAIKDPQANPKLWATIERNIEQMKPYIKVVDAGGWSVSQILAEYDEQLKQTGLNGIRVVFVDFLGIIRPDSSFKNMTKLERNELIVNMLTDKTKRTKSAWVILSQLTRRPPNDKSAPHSSWFKDTSTIEENSGQAIIIMREKLDNGEYSSNLELHIVKNRYGKLGMKSVRIHNETGYITKT